MAISSTLLTALQSALTTAISTPGAGGSLISQLLHTQSTTAGLDVTKKTMTTTFVQNNQQTAVLLEAEGYTVIIG